MEIEPKDCPFCKARVVDMIFFAITPPPTRQTYVFCLSCGAEGPKVSGDDIPSAILAWDERRGPIG